MNKEHKEHRRHGRVFGFFAILLAYCAGFAAAYGFTSLIYHFTGQPPEILRHFITMLTAVGLIMAGWRIILQIGGGHHRKEYHRNAHNQLTDTLAQIAQGDFNILLEPDHIGMYNDLAEAINEMAQSLGTLETMRQDFVSDVSHEIQSPLTSIGGFAKLLKDDSLPFEQRKHYAEIIEAESRRLSSLSDNLLKLSTLDNNKIPLNKTDFRLDKQLETIALTLEPQWAAKNISLEADLQKVTVCADEDLLSQVWINLLHNAIKFTPDGGQINVTLITEEGSAVVKITDTGVGITANDQIHIFERFYKADKARDRSLGGNGLGLSLCKKIAELHGGSITVESEIDRGTIFTVTLPEK